MPTSLFKDGFTSHPNKAALAQVCYLFIHKKIKKAFTSGQVTNEMAEENEKSNYVLDGGVLFAPCNMEWYHFSRSTPTASTLHGIQVREMSNCV